MSQKEKVVVDIGKLFGEGAEFLRGKGVIFRPLEQLENFGGFERQAYRQIFRQVELLPIACPPELEDRTEIGVHSRRRLFPAAS